MECTCYTAVVTIDISNSGVRCTPSSYSSAAVRQLCHPQREATSISAGVSFAGHTAACLLRAASEWRTMHVLVQKATRTDIPIVLPTDPFFGVIQAWEIILSSSQSNATRNRRRVKYCDTLPTIVLRHKNIASPRCLALKPLVSHQRYTSQVLQIRSHQPAPRYLTAFPGFSRQYRCASPL